MVSDSHREPHQEPLSWKDTPETLLKRATTLCERHNHSLQDLMTKTCPETATFDNFMLPIAQLCNEWFSGKNFTFYKEVSPSEEIRKASREAAQILTTKEINIADLASEWVKAIHDNAEELGPESLKFLNIMTIDSTKDAESTSKDRFKAVEDRISEIRVIFDANLKDENGGFWASESELRGVPRRILKELQAGTGCDEGKFRVVYKWATVLSIMEYATDPGLRKKLYLQKAHCVSNNVPLFQEVISLRQEKAILLGQPNFMTYRMQESILETVDEVRKLLLKFQKRIADIGVLDALKETKRLDTDVEDKTFYLWDEHYYKRIWLEKNYSVDHQKIAEYFPVASTIDGMLGVYGEMFGLDFQPVPHPDVWHEDVKLYALWDTESGDFSGYLYIDPHPRPGKFKGAACFELQPSFLRPNGDRRYGSSALVSNLSPLLRHSQLITLFHELGHAIHHLLSRATYSHFHGSRALLDFKEVPSILLEHWCWLPPILTRLSRHHETGAPLPDDLADGLARTKSFQRVLDPFQVALAMFDLVVYTPASQEEADGMDAAAVYNKILCEVTGMEGPEDASTLGSGHVTRVHQVSGCPARYYGYISSYCIAEKIWEALFVGDPMNKEAAKRYRRVVLERGGTRHPAEMLEELLGVGVAGENLCG